VGTQDDSHIGCPKQQPQCDFDDVHFGTFAIEGDLAHFTPELGRRLTDSFRIPPARSIAVLPEDSRCAPEAGASSLRSVSFDISYFVNPKSDLRLYLLVHLLRLR
jgi:hypothetical protein